LLNLEAQKTTAVIKNLNFFISKSFTYQLMHNRAALKEY